MKSDTDTIAIIPSGGWCVKWTSEGKDFCVPLVGWALLRGGDVEPMQTDAAGNIHYGLDVDDALYHPDAEW